LRISDLNADQRALLRWLVAGLQIDEVRNLHGDAGFLLSNMIAKFSLAASAYRLSQGAVRELTAQQIDLRDTYKRSRFYGKNSLFMYEHAVPCSLVRRKLLEINPTLQSVLQILSSAGPVVMVLRTEDQQLRDSGLLRSMPQGWQWGDDPLARYRASGIALSRRDLKVTGQIER
jgi:hypothetical protein